MHQFSMSRFLGLVLKTVADLYFAESLEAWARVLVRSDKATYLEAWVIHSEE